MSWDDELRDLGYTNDGRRRWSAARHGTRAGYRLHKHMGEKPCEECTLASRRYNAEKKVLQWQAQSAFSLVDLCCGAERASIERRLWNLVNRRGPDECWEWTASCQAGGYGQMNIGPRPYRANRISFVMAYGWEPPMVLHKCDNPPCVNPRHLFGGTQADNMADMQAKGRGRRVPPAVRSTVAALGECGASQRAIARQVGIDPKSVKRILAEVKR